MSRLSATIRIWIAIVLACSLGGVLVLKEQKSSRDQANLAFAVTANGWYFAQMQFELMRLSRAIGDYVDARADADEVELRYELVWSRSSILKNSLMGGHPAVADGVDRWENLGSLIENQIFALSAQSPEQITTIRADIDRLAEKFHRIWIDEYASSGYRLSLFQPDRNEWYYNFLIGIVVSLIVVYLGIEATISTKIAAREADARRKADEANAARSLFLANMSHEIRTPLNGVLGVAEILKTTELTDRQRSLVNVISASGRSLMVVITDVLEFSRIEAQGLTLVNGEFDPVELFEEILQMLIVEAEAKDIELALRIESNVPKKIISDPTRLRQVAINIVGNAVKFTDEGYVEVRLSYDAAQERLFVCVEDTGPGVPIVERQRIFQSFIQARSVDRPRGTGLGLAISRKVLDAMNGDIEVSENPAGGSRFSFELPVSSPTQDAVTQPPQIMCDTSILVISPKSRTRCSLVERLRHRGVTVLVVSSSDEAFSMMSSENARGSPVEILVADHSLSDDAALRSLSEQASHIVFAWFGAATSSDPPDQRRLMIPRTMTTSEMCDLLSRRLQFARLANALPATAAAPLPEIGSDLPADRGKSA